MEQAADVEENALEHGRAEGERCAPHAPPYILEQAQCHAVETDVRDCRQGAQDGWLEGRSLGIETGFQIGAVPLNGVPTVSLHS